MIKKLLLLTLALCLLASPAHALITIDANTVDEVSNETSPSTFSHTTAAGATLLTVTIAREDSSDADAVVSSITYNGDALTQSATNDYTGQQIHTDIWHRINPDSGTHDVVVTLAGNAYNMMSCATTWFGTNTTTQPDNTGTESQWTQTPDIDITPTEDDCLIVFGSAQPFSGTDFSSTDQTEIYGYNASSSSHGAGYFIQTTAGLKNMGVNWSGSAPSASVVVSYKPAIAVAGRRVIFMTGN